MAYSAKTLPLTGTGDATAAVATDEIAGESYQIVKLFDATEGSVLPIIAKETTPGSTDAGLIVRNIGSTAFSQAVVGAVGLTSGSSQVGISSGSSEVALTSVGSTKLVGQVTVANPTTAVSLSSQHTVSADLTSAGSTKVVGTVGVSSGLVLGNSTAAIGQLTSGIQTIGTVQHSSAGTTGSIGSVALLAGSTANVIGTIIAGTAGSTINTVGSVALLGGSTANVLGQAVQGPGSTANFWFMQSIPFSSGNLARTTVNTSVDVSIIAANASRKALIIAAGSTAQIVALGLSTGAVTTGLGNANVYVPAGGFLSFGLGGLPLFTGPIRGINISSTTVAGGVNVSEFT